MHMYYISAYMFAQLTNLQRHIRGERKLNILLSSGSLYETARKKLIIAETLNSLMRFSMAGHLFYERLEV